MQTEREPRSVEKGKVFKGFKAHLGVSLLTLAGVVMAACGGQAESRASIEEPETVDGCPTQPLSDRYDDDIINIRDAFDPHQSLLDCAKGVDVALKSGRPDGSIDKDDLKSVVNRFGLNTERPVSADGSQWYNTGVDVDRNGKIDVLDLAFVVRHFGKEVLNGAFGLSKTEPLSYVPRELIVGFSFSPDLSQQRVKEILEEEGFILLVDVGVYKDPKAGKPIDNPDIQGTFFARVSTDSDNFANPDDLGAIASRLRENHPEVAYAERHILAGGPI